MEEGDRGRVTVASVPPHLANLTAPQRRLWDEFASVPAEFVLYGGTAIALHLRHRTCVHFDFFGSRTCDSANLIAAVGFLQAAKITQREPNTLSRLPTFPPPAKRRGKKSLAIQ